LTRDPELWVDRLINFLEMKPSRSERNEAINFVLSKEVIQLLRFKTLAKKGLRKPWEVPSYIFKRARRALGRMKEEV
jgi:hypothetical protein